MRFTCITLSPVHYSEKISHSLKIAEDELLSGISCETPQSDAKKQKLTECVLTRNSMPYLGKADTEEQINKLIAEEVDKLFSKYEA